MSDAVRRLPPVLERLAAEPPVVLDGATGTELHRRGVATPVPLWSAAALLSHPDVVRQIHQDYVRCGAEIVTANTFRTHARSLAKGGLADQASALTIQAVQLARDAAGGAAYVAGSQSPLEDCYSPELTPGNRELDREHAAMSARLAESGVDLILVETQPTIREALAACRAATTTGLPTLVSFVCGTEGRLLSGESVTNAVRAVLDFQPAGLLINCGPAPDLLAPLRELRRATEGVPFGAYANIGRPHPVHGWERTEAEDPTRYARFATSWLELGAHLVGGCCGTTPRHVELLGNTIAARVADQSGPQYDGEAGSINQ